MTTVKYRPYATASLIGQMVACMASLIALPKPESVASTTPTSAPMTVRDCCVVQRTWRCGVNHPDAGRR
jgi:hypothetical protein